MAMTNEQLTKWIDEIFGTIDEIKTNSGDITTLSRTVKQQGQAIQGLDSAVSDLEYQTAGVVSLPKAAVQRFIDGSATQALDMLIDIVPVQAGTGDPSPTNIRAITGFSSENVYVAGFNLCNEQFEVGGIAYASGADAAVSDRIRTVGYTPILPNTDYYFLLPEGGAVFFYAANKNFISYTAVAESGVVKSPENAQYLRFFCYPEYGTTYNNDVCVNYSKTEGSPKNGDYVAFNRTVTISLGSTVYAGTLNPTTGELTITDMCVALDGTEDYTLVDTDSIRADLDLPNIKVSTSTWIYAFSSDFKADANGVAPSDWLTTYNAANPKTLEFRHVVEHWGISEYTTTAWKAYLADRATPLQVCFKLATPTTTTLTPAQIQLLEGENTVYANTGDLSMTYAPDNVLSEVYAYIQKRFDTLTAALTANRTTRKTTKTLTKKED